MSVIRCKMEAPGQCVEAFELEWKEAECPRLEEIFVEGDFRKEALNRYLKETRKLAPGDVKKVELADGILKIQVEPFSNRGDYSLCITKRKYQKADFDEETTEGFSAFEAYKEDDVLYRLYSPATEEKRPLILFLHGGGNGGTADSRDNKKQILADYGPIHFAQEYPDVYVMAPQAIEKAFDPKKMAAQITTVTFETSGGDPENGWSRRYLAKVCDIIRKMIREGKVDENRVYVTGLSMGGGGTIRAMSVGGGLFAACAPVCPTMTPETFDILRTLKAPVWVSTAYVDHTVYRHKYITDAVLEMKDAGNKEAHLTIYSPEELAKYDIGIVPQMTYEQRFGANHASWVLTYHNEHGIMSWLLNQRKK